MQMCDILPTNYGRRLNLHLRTGADAFSIGESGILSQLIS